MARIIIIAFRCFRKNKPHKAADSLRYKLAYYNIISGTYLSICDDSFVVQFLEIFAFPFIQTFEDKKINCLR